MLLAKWLGKPTLQQRRSGLEVAPDGATRCFIAPNETLFGKGKSSPKPLLYSIFSQWLIVEKGSSDIVTLSCSSWSQIGYAYDITFGNLLVARPKYNSTLTFLRLGIDGNIKLCTSYENVAWVAWVVTYNLFERDSCESE
ncbi:hypothetical protein DVH24_003038 [Malus domestica]|uniref:Uncharacterized protein n=1 Tax=Malus domestica TaxID=3750 RepID=A0A498K424_MALDO|nr:hypothetical protein DVH24_003038 [Malus domestica]